VSLNLKTAIHDPRPSWHNPRILSTLLAVFLCGAIAGAVAMRTYMVRTMRTAPAGAVWDKAVYLDNLKRELDLSPHQAKEIEAVLDDFMMFYQSLQSQMDDVRANGKSRILQVLNEEQRKKFEKRLEVLRGSKIR
jgi:uncharacterized membrane protein